MKQTRIFRGSLNGPLVIKALTEYTYKYIATVEMKCNNVTQ